MSNMAQDVTKTMLLMNVKPDPEVRNELRKKKWDLLYDKIHQLTVD